MIREEIYVIKGKKINIAKLMELHNNNAVEVCHHIENICLVEYDTAKYYVNLYMQNEPFIKQNSGTSFACGIIGGIAFVMTALGLGLALIIFPLVFASIICGIVDIATMDSEIPYKHSGTVIGFILDVLLILIALFM